MRAVPLPALLAFGILAGAATVTPSAAEAPAARAPAAKGPAARAPATGTIRGTILFEGEPPPRPALRRDTDPYCARIARDAEDVIVTKGKLKDVLVRIKPGTFATVRTFPAPTTPVVIDQHECMYAPRVVGVMPGQTLAIRNSDGTFHNVHGTIAGTHLWNKPHPPKAADLALIATAAAGDVIDVVCDVHPWMHAYAVVTDHPFVTVTGEDGAFTLTGIPPGSYTLEAWHPSLGTKALTVKIGTGKKATVTARLAWKREDVRE